MRVFCATAGAYSAAEIAGLTLNYCMKLAYLTLVALRLVSMHETSTLAAYVQWV
jgi:hypothetical protein